MAVLRVLAALAVAVALASAHSADEWRQRVIYQLLTDRFARSDGDTSRCSNLGDYCGGTWNGTTSRLGYISELGPDAIWITPIPDNTQGGYHGYWARDLSRLNSKFGQPSDLSAMVGAAHNSDMWVMLDVVINHMGNQPTPNHNDFSMFYPFNASAHYHAYCQIQDWTDQHQVEFCRLAGLPDLAQENSFVSSYLMKWIANIISTYKIDGIRFDTVMEVPLSYWQTFTSALDVYTVGEVDNGDVAVNAPYQVQGALDGTLNYPMYWALRHAFQEKSSMWGISQTWKQATAAFKDMSLLGLFVDNHDNPRFLSVNNDMTSLRNALAWILFADGIPIIYYGTEQAFSGGDDPANREDLWHTTYDTGNPLFQFIKGLIQARKQLPSDFFNATLEEKYVEDDFYAYERWDVLVATTNGGNGYAVQYTIPDLDYEDNTTLVNVLNPSDTIQVNSGSTTVSISDGEPKVYRPKGALMRLKPVSA